MHKFLAGLVLLVATCAAQEFRATISGRVVDSQDAVIGGAKVIATQIGTEARFETVSASDGLYTIPFLPPGSYRLTAEIAGFKRYLRDNLAAGSKRPRLRTHLVFWKNSRPGQYTTAHPDGSSPRLLKAPDIGTGEQSLVRSQ